MRPTLHRTGLHNALLITLVWSLLALAPTARAAIVEGDEASFSWSPASGPVAGYDVFVTRNDVPASSPERVVSGTSVTIRGQVNDMITVRVAAFDEAGNQGPSSSPSEAVLFTAPDLPPPPAQLIVDAEADFSIREALAGASPGEQVIVRMRGSGKQLLDAGIPEAGSGTSQEWGLDQLVVGAAAEATTVRLIDAIGLEAITPLSDLPEVTLFGLGNGPPCARDGGPGLVIHPGSRLVLGGIDLYVFDGERCVHINEMFAAGEDPNVVAFGGGEIQLFGDLEDDGILDPQDNCLLAANTSQCDVDNDGFGNACDFDVNRDGLVNSFDVAMVIRAERMVSTSHPTLDFSCDGVIGLDDLSMLLLGLNAPPGPSGLACAANGTCPPR